MSDVPRLSPDMSNAARRFTWLVDVLYDHRVKLLLSAEVAAVDLYREGANSQEFARTVSRLIEMRTREYMALPHFAGDAAPAAGPPKISSPMRSEHRYRRCQEETPVQKFKAYRTFQENGVVSSRFVEMGLDELDPGDVVVKTKYSTINYKDALSYNGAGKIMRKYPTVAGIDMAGTVDTSADPRFKHGDKVIVHAYDVGVAHDGGYSEYVRVPADWVVRRSPNMTAFEAMTLGHRGFHRGAGDRGDAAQRPDAAQRAGDRQRRHRRRRQRRDRRAVAARLPRHRAYRQGKGDRLPAIDRRIRSRAAVEHRFLQGPSARQGDVGRRRSTTWVAKCWPGCCRR